MRLIVILFALSFFSCTGNKPPQISESQKEFQARMSRYDSLYQTHDLTINPLTKEEYQDSLMRAFNAYLSDSVQRVLHNFRVKVESVELKDVQDVRAFYATFSDKEFNRYWMEFDYDRDSIHKLHSNPAYKLLKDIPEGTDTVLSFFYMGDLKWDYPLGAEIQVVPFPKDYNFDSSIKVNSLKGELR